MLYTFVLISIERRKGNSHRRYSAISSQRLISAASSNIQMKPAFAGFVAIGRTDQEGG